MRAPSLSLALSRVAKGTIANGSLLLVIGLAFILSLSVFTMLPQSSVVLLPNQQSAFASFPGENGQIAFVRIRDDPGVENPTREIYVINADGSGETRLTDNDADDTSPTWSPDGTKIAFTSDRDALEENLEIYVMNADDGSGVTRLTNDPAFDTDPTWSPDGTKIAFTSDRDDSGIYVMNSDGSGQTNLSNNSADDTSPTWSPDGTKIAFESVRDGNRDIYVMNADDGSGQTRLTNNAESDFSPTWSPDGTKIAFTFSINFSKHEISVMNADDGSGVTRLTTNDDADDFNADWGTNTSPAGGGGSNGDTTPPALTVPDDMVVEATSSDGVEVTYPVTAVDKVDGTATLEEDGTTVTQDNVGGDITISCEPASGSVFPIGKTTVECSATDEAGNTATASFTVTVPHPSCRGEAATIIGTDGNDDLVGTSNRDVIAGLGGNDDISGLGGNDLMCGGSGSDTMAGGAGNDIMTGQSGNDQMAGSTGNDQLLGEGGNDGLAGGADTDSANGGAGTNDTCTAETETNCEA